MEIGFSIFIFCSTRLFYFTPLIMLNPNRSKELQNAVSGIFQNTNSTEINALLALMLDVYLRHAQVEKIDLSNTVFSINDLSLFLVHIENLNNNTICSLN